MTQTLKYKCNYSDDDILVFSWDLFDSYVEIQSKDYSVGLCLTHKNVEDIISFLSVSPSNNDVFEIRLSEAVWSVAFIDNEFCFEVETTAGFINVYISHAEWMPLVSFLARFLNYPSVPTF